MAGSALCASYVEVIREIYGLRTWHKCDFRADEAAVQIDRLGISYRRFFQLAVPLWEGWCAEKGMKFPHWNVLVSASSIERVRGLLEVSDGDPTSGRVDEFSCELDYALLLIDWIKYGGEDPKCRKTDNTGHSLETKRSIIRYLCLVYGIPYTDHQDYYSIAERLSSDA